MGSTFNGSFCKCYSAHFEIHWNLPITTDPVKTTAQEEMLEEQLLINKDALWLPGNGPQTDAY